MKWTKDLPDKPGYYVVRFAGEKKPEDIVRIYEDGSTKAKDRIYFRQLGAEFEWLSLNDEE